MQAHLLMSPLPTSPADEDTETETGDVDETMVISLQDESDVFSVLAAKCAREILIELYENPAATSEVATQVGTSVQNAQYHLEKLMDAGIVEAVSTKYSSRGREMTVYAPTDNPLTVILGDADCLDTCRSALTDADTE